MHRFFRLIFLLPEPHHVLANLFVDIFCVFDSGNRNNSEVLVSTEHCLGDRRALHTHCPGERVMDDVISLVAVMCSEGAMSESVLKRWWLPTSFQQIAVNPTNYCPKTLEYIKEKFMGKTDKLFKVYVPLHADDHWYLMIIDFFNWKLVYLDSLKDSRLTKARKDQMLYVVFYDGTPDEMHKPSTYEIVDLEIGQQADGS
ncbi:hypothetical protein AHAS_Ahas20G0103700 [Arachis hypogaea]